MSTTPKVTSSNPVRVAIYATRRPKPVAECYFTARKPTTSNDIVKRIWVRKEDAT